MRLSVSKVGAETAERLLNDVNVWTRVRNDPLVTILTAKVPLDIDDDENEDDEVDWLDDAEDGDTGDNDYDEEELNVVVGASSAPPPPPPPPRRAHRKSVTNASSATTTSSPSSYERNRTMRLYLYLTKPTDLLIYEKRRNMHLTVVVNYSRVVGLLAHVSASGTPIGDGSFSLTVSKSKLCPTPLADLPDPRNEPVPVATPSKNYKLFTTSTFPPLDSDNCVCLAHGAWWHYPSESVYFFHLKNSMKSICPAGWKNMMFFAILSAFVDPKGGCDACPKRRDNHADQFDNTDKTSTADICPCAEPCRHGDEQMAKRVLRPRGESNMLKLLFVGHVETMTPVQHRGKRGRIPGDITGVLRGKDSDGQRVPQNCLAWELRRFSKFASRSLLCGCSELRRLVEGATERRPLQRDRKSPSPSRRCSWNTDLAKWRAFTEQLTDDSP